MAKNNKIDQEAMDKALEASTPAMEAKNKYALLFYDIHTKDKDLYNRVWKSIRRKAIGLNGSVYLVFSQYVVELDNQFRAAEIATGKKACWNWVVPDDNGVNGTNLEKFAQASLSRDVMEQMGRIRDYIKRLAEEDEIGDPDSIKRGVKKIKEFETLAAIYGMGDDMGGLFTVMKQGVQAVWDNFNKHQVKKGGKTYEPTTKEDEGEE